MDLKEAREWLKGERSMMNIIPQDPHETRLMRIACADAACTKQAYYIAKAYEEGLVGASRKYIPEEIVWTDENWHDVHIFIRESDFLHYHNQQFPGADHSILITTKDEIVRCPVGATLVRDANGKLSVKLKE